MQTALLHTVGLWTNTREPLCSPHSQCAFCARNGELKGARKCRARESPLCLVRGPGNLKTEPAPAAPLTRFVPVHGSSRTTSRPSSRSASVSWRMMKRTLSYRRSANRELSFSQSHGHEDLGRVPLGIATGGDGGSGPSTIRTVRTPLVHAWLA